MSQIFGGFHHGITPLNKEGVSAYWFLFQDARLLVSRAPRRSEGGDDEAQVPCLEDPSSLGLEVSRIQYLGIADGRPCMTAEVASSASPPSGWAFEGLRSLFGAVSEDLFRVAGTAIQILEWDRTHNFCGKCGTPTRGKDGERARECPACGLLSFPRIAPAIIVAVIRGERILLARAHRFPPDLFSVLAGFVEPGETLEECVVREVREETAIETRGIRYFASQPWPFPHSLMVAFTAEYAGGEIEVERAELAEAGWFFADHLPRIPDKLTVARKLIDWFVGRSRKI